MQYESQPIDQHLLPGPADYGSAEYRLIGDSRRAHYNRFRWLRFAERLDELAVFAADLHPPVGADVVAAVSAALGRMALDLTAHVEAV